MTQSDAFRIAYIPNLSYYTPLTFENREEDNGFLEYTMNDVVGKATRYGYTLLGIGKSGWINRQSVVDNDICIVFKTRDGNIRWCHLNRTYYFHLLEDKWGRDEAAKIYERVLNILQVEL